MEDFSFPTIPTEPDSLCQLPFPHFATSPLWFHHHHHHHHHHQEDAPQSPNSPATDDPPLDREEKMDMLWEDFNEELHRAPFDTKTDAELRCVMSKRGGGLIHHGKPSLVMLLKVLKKLFLIQKSAPSPRRAASLLPDVV